MDSGLQHFHQRKRIYQKREPYPHPNPYKAFLDRIIFLAGIAGPILLIPQAWQIWAEKNAGGISLFSWIGILFIACVWLLYGIVHRDKPIIVMYIGWILVEAMVVFGAILYR